MQIPLDCKSVSLPNFITTGEKQQGSHKKEVNMTNILKTEVHFYIMEKQINYQLQFIFKH